jgi:hypothetical protein
LNGMQEAVRQAAQKAAEEQHKKMIEALTAVNKGMYDSAASYVNIIMAGGYAGAFAVWTLAGDALSKEQRSWAGLWLFVSLAVFVLWEVAKMILLGVQAIQFQRLVSTKVGELPKQIGQYQAAQDKLMMKFHISWAVFVLPVSIGTALAASGVLVHAFLTNLF